MNILIAENHNVVSSDNLTENHQILIALRDYVKDVGMGKFEVEIEDAFTGKGFDLGELYHLIFDKAKQNGVYPNLLGCFDRVRWLCYDLFYDRIQIV